MSGENNNHEPDPYAEVIDDQAAGQEDLIPEKGESKQKNKIELDQEATDKVNPLEDFLITEEIAKEYGFDRKLIGKPFKEGFNSYKELQKYDTKLSQSLAEINRKMDGFEQKLSKAELKEVKETVEEKLPDYETEYEKIYDQFVDGDGFILDKAGMAKALGKFNREYNALQTKLMKKEVMSELEDKNAPTATSVQELRKEKYLADLYDGVNDELIKEYGEDKATPEMVQKILDEYGELMSEEDQETQDQYTRLYSGRPQKLVRDAMNYHKASRKLTPEKTDKEKAAIDVHNKNIEKLKNTNKTFVKSAASSRDSREQIAKEDQPYADAIDEALDDEYNTERFGGE